MWFLMWLFTSIANASPVGTEFVGAKLGYPVPSSYKKEEDGVYRKDTEFAGLEGFSSLKTCGTYVDSIFFFHVFGAIDVNTSIKILDMGVKRAQLTLLSDNWEIIGRNTDPFKDGKTYFREFWIKEERITQLMLANIQNNIVLIVTEGTDTPCTSAM